MIAGSRDESAELNPTVVSQAGNDPHCAGASKPDIWVTAIQLIVVVTVQTCFFTCPVAGKVFYEVVDARILLTLRCAVIEIVSLTRGKC